MRTMIDLGSQRSGHLYIMQDTATSVDCSRQVRLRRSFRSLVECMVPTCCGGGFPPISDDDDTYSSTCNMISHYPQPHHVGSGSRSTVTGTFFGYRKGRVSFCIQDDTRSSPLLLLEFAIPTSYLAKEMEHGLLRIALECQRRHSDHHDDDDDDDDQKAAGAAAGSNININANSKWRCKCRCSLYQVPVWSMYCNGRKVGFAIRRQMKATDFNILKLMQSLSVGAGVLPVSLPAKSSGPGDNIINADLMYLRASFHRYVASPDSESFHIINPVGSSTQELSLFLLRS